MLIDRYTREDILAQVPETARHTDPVLVQIDHLLDDDVVFQQVRADLARRHPRTTRWGRPSTPVEVILRMLAVKRLYNWSYEESERYVADSFVLRWFCRVYWQRVPDDTTLLRWARLITAPTLQALNERVVQLAHQAQVIHGRKLRLDGMVVPTAIHHPTDSSLLVDGVRVLSRLLRRSKPLVGDKLGGVRDAFRPRLRTMRRALQAIHRTARQTGEAAAEQRRAVYAKMVETAEQTVRQAARVRQALDETADQAQRAATRLREHLDRFVPLVRRVIHQARTRVLDGQTVPAEEKIVSLFEPHTRVIRRRKGGADVEFGRLVVIDEVEGGLVTRYHILEEGATEHGELAPALAHHRDVFGRAPRLVTGDRGFHAPDNARRAREAGVKHLVIPAGGKTAAEQRAREKERSWRRRYRWRAGIEGRINSLDRDYGLGRCVERGEGGLDRCVGWGILASNLHHIGHALAARDGRGQQRAA
jgi:transposase, IS5 family